MNDFIKNFADQFDDTDISEFNPETYYRDLDEWASLTGLAVLNMVKKKYNVHLSASEMRSTNTIHELFDLVQSKL